MGDVYDTAAELYDHGVVGRDMLRDAFGRDALGSNQLGVTNGIMFTNSSNTPGTSYAGSMLIGGHTTDA